MNTVKASVIFSTYNSTAWLEKVLWGFFCQTVRDFEIVIADDGSTEETRSLIDRMRVESEIPIKHVWQRDDGFQKSRILNKAIAATEGEYVIFTDGDCIPRNDFVAQHLRFAEKGCYLSGGYFKLPMDVSKAITKDDIVSQRAFDLGWLKDAGFKTNHKALKLIAKGRFADFLNRISRTRTTWNGHSASCHREHIVAVNGFNENMQYGGQDCEFGYRLVHLGLEGKRIRYSAICLHLDHSRGYSTLETRLKNREISAYTKKHKVVRSPLGLDQYLNEDTRS
ncbi:MAG: glycosyl transferase family 2 [Desulfuromonas sp.]|nr:MAG: glycosyl transferase family 2 [Desulfuromonas sp.]